MITIQTDDKHTHLYAPYTPELPDKAKALGGRFDRSNRAWRFDARDENRVRDLSRKVYGTDGSDADDTVTVRVQVNDERPWHERRQGLFLGGHPIARAYSRDSGAEIADGVVVLQGDIRSSGSAKNWTTRADEETIFEVRDVPRGMAEKMIEQASEKRAVTGDPLLSATIEETVSERISALRAERQRLLDRIAEIDAELNGDEGADGA
jgi:hypothetical protein